MSKSLTLYFIAVAFLFSGCQFIKDKANLPDDKYLHGKVVGIIDGDTYTLLTDNYKTIKVRMQGIDAPERQMPYYKASRTYLSKLIYKKEVKLLDEGQDVHGRTLAFTFLKDGTDINHEMLKAGMVWHFKRYSSDRIMAQLEKDARKSKIGLWADENPVAPWDYRKQSRFENAY